MTAFDPIADIARGAHHAAMNAEISWDLVMSRDMPFAEGCYRLEGHDWQVITVVKARGAYPVGVSVGVTWPSGVTGMSIVLPDQSMLNASVILTTMSDHLGVTLWREVKGPDSMQLR